MRGTVGLVAVALLLGGCASGAAEPAPTTIGAVEPSVAAAPTPSVEASAEPGVRAPEMPALAREQTPEGAVAFAEWWFATLNYATATGDTRGLVAASDPRCETCNSYIVEIDNAYAGGGSMQGGLFLANVQPAGPIQEFGVKFPVFLDVGATTFVDEKSEITDSYIAETVAADFTAAWSNAGWIAGGLTLGAP